MTDQPDQPSQGEQHPIDADLGNYDESGYAVAAPGEASEDASQAEGDPETSAEDGG